MGMNDTVNGREYAQSIAPQVAGSTLTGTGVDLAGQAAADVVFDFGLYGGTGTATPSVEHSDDDSSYSSAASYLIGSANLVAVSSTSNDNLTQKVGYNGTKRYIRAKVTVAGGTPTLPAAATVVLTPNGIQPV